MLKEYVEGETVRALIPKHAIDLDLFCTWSITRSNEKSLRKIPLSVQDLTWPVISPDGTQNAYVSNDRLWIRTLDEAMARETHDSEGTSWPFWSSQSACIGYDARTELR